MAVPWVAVCTDASSRRPGIRSSMPEAPPADVRQHGPHPWHVRPRTRDARRLKEPSPSSRRSLPPVGLRDRGVLREGALADVVVVDAAVVADVATYEAPARFPDRHRRHRQRPARGRGRRGDRRASGSSVAAATRDSDPRAGAMEAPAIAELPGGPLPYTLRHSPRARTLRVVIHPDRGVIVTLPATRSAQRDGERRRPRFLGEREAWVRRHLDQQAATGQLDWPRGGARDGGAVRSVAGSIASGRPGGTGRPSIRGRVRRRAGDPSGRP